MAIVTLELKNSGEKINEVLKDNISLVNKEDSPSYWDGFMMPLRRRKELIKKEFFLFDGVSIPILEEGEEKIKFDFNTYGYQEKKMKLSLILIFLLSYFLSFPRSIQSFYLN